MQPKRPPDDVLSYIRENFVYDIDTGSLWRLQETKSRWVETGRTVNNHGGRYEVVILSVTYKVQNICWFLHYKEWPIHEVDHEDRNGFNNKLSNLRYSTRSRNLNNRDMRKNNKYIGVGKKYDKYQYRFIINGKTYYKYGFRTDKEAAIAREKHLDELGDTFCARNKNLE